MKSLRNFGLTLILVLFAAVFVAPVAAEDTIGTGMPTNLEFVGTFNDGESISAKEGNLLLIKNPSNGWELEEAGTTFSATADNTRAWEMRVGSPSATRLWFNDETQGIVELGTFPAGTKVSLAVIDNDADDRDVKLVIKSGEVEVIHIIDSGMVVTPMPFVLDSESTVYVDSNDSAWIWWLAELPEEEVIPPTGEVDCENAVIHNNDGKEDMYVILSIDNLNRWAGLIKAGETAVIPLNFEDAVVHTAHFTFVSNKGGDTVNLPDFGPCNVLQAPSATMDCDWTSVSNPNSTAQAYRLFVDDVLFWSGSVEANNTVKWSNELVFQDELVHSVYVEWVDSEEETQKVTLDDFGPCVTSNACQLMDMNILEQGDNYIVAEFTVNATNNEAASGAQIDFGDGSPVVALGGPGPWTFEHRFESDVEVTWTITASILQDGKVVEVPCSSDLSMKIVKECQWWYWVHLTWLDRDRVIHNDPFGHAIALQASNCHIENGTPNEGIPFFATLQLFDHEGNTDTAEIAMTRVNVSESNVDGTFKPPTQMSVNGSTATHSHQGMGRYDKVHFSFQAVPTVDVASYPPEAPYMLNAYFYVNFTDPDGKVQTPYKEAKWLTILAPEADGYELPHVPTYYWLNNTTIWQNGDSWANAAGRCGISDEQAMLDLNHWWTVVPDAKDEDKRWPFDGQVLACAWSGATDVVVVEANGSLADFAAAHGTTAEELIAINGLQGRFQQEVFAGQVISFYINSVARIN